MNKAIHDEVMRVFNNRVVSGSKQSLLFSNVKPEKNDNSYGKLIDAVNRGGTVSQKYRADVSVVDNETGKKVDEKKGVYIGDVPIYTKKGGFVVDGNTYNLPSQIRLKSGAYTLNKASGDVETMYNVRKGTGMKIISPSDKSDVKLMIRGRQFNPGDVAKILGASDKEIEKTVGKDVHGVLQKNSDVDGTALKLAQTLGLVGKDINPPKEEVRKHLTEYFAKTELDSDVTKHTLGKPVSTVNKDAILLGVKKNVGVKKGIAEEDDKENLMFKKVLTADKLMGEGIERELKKHEFKMKAKLNNPFQKASALEILREPLLKHTSKSFLTTSAISRMPEEYNPLHTLQGNNDITPLGEGGISSSEMITPSVRSLHVSQLGFIDPIKSPEGANTGVTLSTTRGAYVDKDGNPAIKVKNLKTGKTEIKTVGDLWDKKVAFPDPDKHGEVGIREKSNIRTGKIKEADYQISHAEDMYGPAMNALGLISSNDPTRNLMASKHVTQALPLKEPDVNPVSLLSEAGSSMLKELAKNHLPVAKHGGVVTRVDSRAGKIHYKDSSGRVHVEDYAVSPIQLNTKTFIKHKPIVKAGQKIAKGEALADSNFTKNGELAIGKNLRTAWMMYPGTRNDAFVVSESAAKKLTSVHSSKFDIDGTAGTILDKKKFVTMFPEIAKKIDINKYDDRGIIKHGEKVAKDEPIVLGMRKMDPSEVRFANDKVKKLLYGGMAPVMQKWKGDNTATITNVSTKGSQHRVIAEYEAQLKTGDKLAGRSGNKGVVSAVIPDKDMPRDESGKPVELILGGAGVISRQNPAQILEGALTEISKKTGKKYTMPHYTHDDLKKFVENEADKHNVKLYHTITDPLRGVKLKNKVFVSDYNILKLFKQGEGTYSAIGHGGVDSMDQPRKGGKESASSISNMEVNSLLAHGAKDFLREVSTVKSHRNKEWFDAFHRGEVPPPPKRKAARDHFHGLLNQMNINVVEDGTKVNLLPMTDKDIVSKSTGEVKEPFGLKRNTLTPVEGGFYDTKIFGGHGENFAHIDLGVKVVNPLYKKPMAAMLGTTEKGIDREIEKGNINDLYKRIKSIKPASTIKQLKSAVSKTKDVSKADRIMKSIKALKKIESEGVQPADAMFMSKIPVLPVKMRPVSKLPDGSVIEHDVNLHYANITRAANTLKTADKKGVPGELKNKLHREIQEHVGAMYGTNPSPDKKLVQKETKSMLDIVAGGNPKTSFWHQKILRNKVFSSGRSVIVPHNKSLDIDKVEIPKYVAWKTFEPHVVRKMSQMGIPSDKAKDMIEKQNETATNVLNQVMKEVPVVINRSPSLHKHNMTGHYAKISGGNVMHIPPEVEVGQNADYDGDQLAIHVPLGKKAIDDVKNKMMASKQLFSSSQKDKLIMGIDLDPFIGFFDATKKKGK